ncbi:hypothetical protein ACQ4PT_058378 [Festuca glaucescens]
MVAAALVLLEGSDQEEGVATAVIAVTAADTTVLDVALASLALAMASAGNWGSRLVEVEVFPLGASPPSSRASPVAPPMLATMDRGSSSRMNSELTLGNSIEVQTTAIFIAMEGVVAALAAAAQRGGAEGVASSALGAVASTGAQMEAPAVQQPQTVAAGVQQTQPMQVDAMPKADVPNPAKKAKKADNCFRCKKPGHQIDTCTAPVCDIFVVTQLDGNDLANNGDNNGGGGNDGANEDYMDSANDMDIERAKNNELQGNVNSQKSNGKKTYNAKGVVGHQVQHHVEDPILVGSLNTDQAASSLGIGAGRTAKLCAATGKAEHKWRSATG